MSHKIFQGSKVAQSIGLTFIKVSAAMSLMFIREYYSRHLCVTFVSKWQLVRGYNFCKMPTLWNWIAYCCQSKRKLTAIGMLLLIFTLNVLCTSERAWNVHAQRGSAKHGRAQRGHAYCGRALCERDPGVGVQNTWRFFSGKMIIFDAQWEKKKPVFFLITCSWIIFMQVKLWRLNKSLKATLRPHFLKGKKTYQLNVHSYFG